ncbi:DNRLRE domain-containing protein [Streptomyces sp. NPDC049887]|uniref:DNRLRE domain-containing protein n=2 Tax=Streptomyces TaxID=1883 RepID=UPI0034486E55
MDASKTADGSESSPPESAVHAVEPATAGSRPTRSRRRRGLALLASVLAAAVAVPVAVHLTGDHTPEPSPRAGRDSVAPRPVDEPEAIREARRTGKDVVVTARHTANSTTWAQPDGLLRTRTYSDTIRARAGSGWKPIDTTLQRVEGGFAPKAVNDPLLFSAGSAAGPTGGERASRASLRTHPTRAANASADGRAWSELVRLTTGEHEIVVSWPGPLPEPVVDGSRALYENVRPGIDLLLTARDSGYSHVLVVRTREAATDPLLGELDYRLASATLTFTLDEESNAVSARDSAGQELAAAPTPYLWDSAGQVKATIGDPVPELEAALRGTALALPGLEGPQPGSRDAVLGASLGDDGTLSLDTDRKLLTDPDTVYPVFIDPSFKGRKKNWTLLYKSYPSSSFYNGQNFNNGTNEARVGYESDSGGLSRSVFTFEFGSALHGSTIKSATFRALQTYSWGCSSRQFNLYQTGSISSSSTWNKQPSWTRLLSSQTNGHGYKSGSCPDKWVALDIKSAAQDGASGKWSALTLGLRAANESDTNAWKKFMANGESAPYIEVVYNNPPNEPTASAMKTVPGSTCDTASPFPGVGKTDLTFTVTGSDRDGNLKYVNLHIWPTGDTAHPVRNTNYVPNSAGTINVTVPWTEFTHGKTYSWTARTIDSDGYPSAWGPSGTTANCQFTVDQTAPNSPAVSSTDFPPPGDDGATWSAVRFGTAGLVTFSPNGTSDVKEYQYSFNTAFDLKASPNPAREGRAIVSVSPPHAGPSVLYVRSVDSTGNISQATKYLFNVLPSPVLDTPGDVTGDGVPDVYTVNPDGDLELFAKTAGNDRLHFPMAAAYTTGSGEAKPVSGGYWTGALITHNGDWLPGDGIQDLVARMADGKLYVYPGDGYGGFDVTERREVLLPAGSPDPAAIRQILSVGDVTGDARPDLLAIAGANLWAFTGYTGVSFEKATHLSGEDWTQRDLVQVGGIAGDGAVDLVFRENPVGRLHLRYGKAAAGGGVSLGSFATKAAAGGQLDTYGASGWSRSALPILAGTPDVDGDGLPEVWALFANGDVRVYPGRGAGLTTANAFYVVKQSVGTSWLGHGAIG